MNELFVCVGCRKEGRVGEKEKERGRYSARPLSEKESNVIIDV